MISIIIPFYNAEVFLLNLINCLNKQTSKNFEAIFVDSCSTDNSLDLLKHTTKDFRYKIVMAEKKGVSHARNLGINYSSGDYLCFFDADDLLEPIFVEYIIKATSNNLINVGVFNYYEKTENNIKEKKLPSSIIKNQLNLSQILVTNILGIDDKPNNIMMPVWRCFFNKKFIDSIKLHFDEKLFIAEDMVFCLKALLESKEFYYLNEELYIYVRNRGSALNSYHKDYYKNGVYLESLINEILNSYSATNSFLIKGLITRRFRLYTYSLSNFSRNSNFKESCKDIKSICNEFNLDSDMKQIYRKLNFPFKIVYILMRMKLAIMIKILFSLKEHRRKKAYFKYSQIK